jgi:hypothetical protein
MRADIEVGAMFPDYELTDHSRRRRCLSEIQGVIPLSWSYPAGISVPRTGGNCAAFVDLHPEPRFG